ncbi:MAG TPA: enoyl-CoA hydratase/isomerase [Bacillota bacterium]
MNYQTIKVRLEGPVCYLQLYRPEAKNTINDCLVEECHQVLELCKNSATIVVLEGLPEVFCFGADFQGIHNLRASGEQIVNNPEPLYDLWVKMATGPYITISHIRGRVNAGGMGFVGASDIVIADQTAQFSLSELLFGLFPACVLPFLVRRIGFQKAHYMTLMTQPISVQQAHTWGMVDAYDAQSDLLLRRHLLRLKLLPQNGVLRYKRYMSQLNDILVKSKQLAVAANQAIFADPQNLEWICRFVEEGKFPWDQ